MTTTAATASAVPQPARDRGLGRGVSTLIPQGAALSPTGQAAAALAALRTVPVHAGLLQAAALLLEESARTSDDDAARATITHTVELLRAVLEPAAE
ncbi:hypothetical protein ACWDZ4_30375 [Streptomyces sp. NPDC003016]